MSKMNEYTSVDTFQPDEKTAFLDSASILATGKDTSGAPVTANIPMNEFGGSNINSISLDGNNLEPDSNKNVNVPLATTAAAGAMSSTDKSKLDNLTGVPSTQDAKNGSMLTYDEADGVIWTSPTEFWRDNIDYDTHYVNDEGKLTLNWSIIDDSGGLRLYNGSMTTVGVNLSDDGGINRSSDGELYVQTDNTLVRHEKVGYGDTYLSVAVPVPDPEEHNAEEGDVLTYDGDDIVWSTPFTPPPADNYDNNAVLTVQVDNHGNPSYQWERRVQVVYAGTGLRETSSSAADVQATLAIDTYDAHNGDVMCYDRNREVFWSDRVTLLEARVAALEEALGGNRFTVNGDNPTVNGDTPTVG